MLVFTTLANNITDKIDVLVTVADQTYFLTRAKNTTSSFRIFGTVR